MRPELFAEIEPITDPAAVFQAATIWDGWLESDGEVLGTIQAKVAKLTARGAPKVTVSVVEGGRKIGGRGQMETGADGSASVSCALKDGRTVHLAFGQDELYGTLPGAEIRGARTIFTSRRADDKQASEAILARLQRTAVVYWNGNALSVVVAKKGKCKVSGSLSSGARVSASSQLVAGEAWCAVPVVYAKRGADVRFLLWMNRLTGEVVVEGLGEGAKVQWATVPGETLRFRLEGEFDIPGATVLLGLGDQALLGAVPVRNDGTPTGTGLSYASSKTKYVTVAADGILTGKKKGSSVVTVTAANGVTAKCTVKVVKAPKSVKLSADKRLLKFDAAQGIADTARLQVILPKNTASHIAYSGYDPAVVSVAADGTVTATGLGTTSITAATYNGKTDSFRVTVCAPGKQYNADVVNVAHRGGKGNWTENTVTAFQNTAATGARAVELDARSTKDGVQVVHHDATFNAGGKQYTLKKLTLAQIRALDPNICTLDEALDVLAGTNLEINLELKDTANAKSCVQAIKKRGLQSRTMYISFLIKQLKAVRKADGATRLGLVINETPKNLAKTLKSVKATYVFQKADYLTSANLYDWQDAGLKVGVWTVNDAVAMTNWLAMGVDYITSDYPEQVTALLR